jgi:UDP:flavonoid glycosyltransferase YjiC (YdhE family)
MGSSAFLLTTWQGGGVLPPELGLARRLIQAGHRVRVLSEPTVEPDATAAGCSFTPRPTAPSMNAVNRDTAAVKDWTGNNPMTTFRRGSDLMFGQADRFAHDVLGTLALHGADALLIDVMQFGALIAAERSGLPTIGLLPSIYVRPTRGHPMMGTATRRRA